MPKVFNTREDINGTVSPKVPFIVYMEPHKRRQRKTFAFTMNSKGSVTVAVARCSRKDNFRRKVGSSIVLARLAKYEEDPTNEKISKYIIEFDTKALANIINVHRVQGAPRYRSPVKSFSIPVNILGYINKTANQFLRFTKKSRPKTKPVEVKVARARQVLTSD